jgi:hypothetical protein
MYAMSIPIASSRQVKSRHLVVRRNNSMPAQFAKGTGLGSLFVNGLAPFTPPT